MRFECGDISVPDQTKCGELDGDVYHLRECPKHYHCETEDYYNPEKIGDAFCVPDETKGGLTGLAPGDLCYDGDSCFGEGKCIDGVCVPKNGTEGSSCRAYMSENDGWISRDDR